MSPNFLAPVISTSPSADPSLRSGLRLTVRPAGLRGPAASTLTNLYNARPTWLELAHKKLDEAVFAAYGWPGDLSDEEILEPLLALNLERAVIAF